MGGGREGEGKREGEAGSNPGGGGLRAEGGVVMGRVGRGAGLPLSPSPPFYF